MPRGIRLEWKGGNEQDEGAIVCGWIQRMVGGGDPCHMSVGEGSVPSPLFPFHTVH